MNYRWNLELTYNFSRCLTCGVKPKLTNIEDNRMINIILLNIFTPVKAINKIKNNT